MVHTIVAVEQVRDKLSITFFSIREGRERTSPLPKANEAFQIFNMHLILNVQVSQKRERGLARASLISPVLVVDLLIPLRQLNVSQIFPIRGSDVCYVCNAIMLIRLQKSSKKWDNFGGRRCIFVILLHVQLSVSGCLD